MPDAPRERRGYYDILGVVDSATPEEVEEAFRKLAQKWHPDVCPNVQQAAANFKRVAEAFEVLGDPEKRRRYDDSERRRRRRRASAVTQPHSTDRPDSLGVFGIAPHSGLLGGFHSLLDSLSSEAWTRPAAATPTARSDLRVEADLLLTPEEAHRGGVIQFRLRFDQACPECDEGGRTAEAACATCGGGGQVQQGPRLLTICVPPGVWNGSLIRVPGEGKSPPGLGPPGDLVLRVRVQPSW
jgi:DnaJ-class molecular chaperone